MGTESNFGRGDAPLRRPNVGRNCFLSPISSALLLVFLLVAGARPERATPQRSGNARQAREVERWSAGYWTPWGKPGIPVKAIDWGGLTHVIYAWALVKPNGTLDLQTQRIDSDGPVLVDAAHAHGVKALLGVGQPYWIGETTNIQSAMTENRKRLVNNIVTLVEAYGFDGVDLDWEPFNPRINGPAMDSLAADLRSRLGRSKTLSAAAIITDSAYWGSVQRYFDRIAVMTYDMAGTWDPFAWHNAALYGSSTLSPEPWSVDLAVRRFTQAGVPRAKLSIGLPFFGYEWTGISGPGERWKAKPGLRQMPYQAIVAAIDNRARVHWDPSSRVPYVILDGRFLSYDNEESIREKIGYVKRNGLGGWIIWDLSGDYIPSRNPNQPLLNVVKNAK